MPAPGAEAPDFRLLDQDGREVRLSDFRGRKVVIFAYPRAATPGCTTQACGFADEHPRIEAAGAVVLGLSPDTPAVLKKWREKMGFSYDLLSDPEHRVLEAWGAWGEKSMYGRRSMGVIRSHWVIGEDGRVLEERLKIGPKDSVAAAVARLAG